MENVQKIKIVLADDHELLRHGFRSILKEMDLIDLVAEATNGEELYALVKQHMPDVVITDIKMPLLNGIEVTKKIKRRFPYIKIIILSNYDEKELIVDLVSAGADGYLVKSASPQELLAAIKNVHAGKNFFCSASSTKIADHLQDAKKSEPLVPLTRRQRELLVFIGRGMTNREIGDKLAIGIRTVETHRLSIQQKLNLKTPVAIALYALKYNYIDKDDLKFPRE